MKYNSNLSSELVDEDEDGGGGGNDGERLLLVGYSRQDYGDYGAAHWATVAIKLTGRAQPHQAGGRRFIRRYRTEINK